MTLTDSEILARKTGILIVEDSPTIRHALKRTLEQAIPDCCVQEAEDGRQALQSLGRMSASLIISDLQMPRMDGWTFLKTLRANPVLKKKPVIVLSSEPLETQPEELRADPMLRFLAKPATATQIAQAAGELLDSLR